MFFFSLRICSLYLFRLFIPDGDIWDTDRGSYSTALLLLSHSVHLCGRSKDEAQFWSVPQNCWWNIRSEIVLATASFHKIFYYTLQAVSYREKHLSFTGYSSANSKQPGCSGPSAGTTTSGSVGFVGPEQSLTLAPPSYHVVTKHGCLKSSDLILPLFWTFQSLTSFNCCNSTSQSEKSWNFFRVFKSKDLLECRTVLFS